MGSLSLRHLPLYRPYSTFMLTSMDMLSQFTPTTQLEKQCSRPQVPAVNTPDGGAKFLLAV